MCIRDRFSTAVKAMMNSTGLRPRKSAFAPTFEMRTETISVRISTP